MNLININDTLCSLLKEDYENATMSLIRDYNSRYNKKGNIKI